MQHIVRRPRTAAIAFAVVGLAVCSAVVAPPASAAATGTVTGRVVDDTGAPVKGLAVSARNGADTVVGTTTTATDGTYRLTAKTGDRAICFDGRSSPTASGGYSFTCFGGTTAATATPVSVTAVTVHQGVSVTVTRRALVTGRVTDTANHPLTGVGIHLNGLGAAATTGTDGTYRIAVDTATNPITSVCFEAAAATGGTSATGYADACSAEFPLRPGGVRTVNRPLTPAAGAAGRVTDTAGHPVAGAQVSLPGVTVRTRTDGTYRAIGADPGPGQILVTPPTDAPGPTGHGLLPLCVGGTTPAHPSFDCGDAPPVSLVAGRVTPGLDAVLPNASALVGRVTDDLGVPIPDVPLIVGRTAEGYPILVTTDADGDWTARNLFPGAGYGVCTWYGLVDLHTPDPDGYSSNCLVDGDGGLSEFTLAGDDVVITNGLVLTGLGRAVGRVVDAVTGRPVAGVDVAVQSFGQEPVHVTTGPDGSYVVGDLTAGENGYCVFPQAARFPPPLGYAGSCPLQPISTTLIDAPTFLVTDRGDTTAPTVRLLENGTVAGRVVDAAGFPLQNVQVVVANPTTSQSQTLATDARGRYVTAPIAPGQLSVCFSDPGTAHRAGDGTRPPGGYQQECWNNRADPEPIVAVPPGQRRTGVDAALAARPVS